MLLHRSPAVVALLTPDTSAETFRRLRKLSGITLNDVVERMPGAYRSDLNFFELGQRTLALRHRVAYAKVLNAALAERVRELREIGALPDDQETKQISP